MLVPVVQFVDDGMAQYAFTLAVDEDELLASLRLVLFDRAAEDIQLVFQYIGRGHSGCRLQQLVCMEVYDNFVVILRKDGLGMNSRLSALLSPHPGAFSSVARASDGQ